MTIGEGDTVYLVIALVLEPNGDQTQRQYLVHPAEQQAVVDALAREPIVSVQIPAAATEQAHAAARRHMVPA